MNNFRIEGFIDADYCRLKTQMAAEKDQRKSARGRKGTSRL